MSRIPVQYKCLDCSEDVSSENFDMVVLPNNLWLSIANTEDLLCKCCIEKRLGRKLTFNDFPDYDVYIYRNTNMFNVRNIIINRIFFSKVGWI